MDRNIESETEAVFQNHLKSILAKDLDGVMEGFAEDAVVFAPDGPIRGLEAIRSDTAAFIGQITPEFVQNFEIGRQDIHGDVVYFTWSSGDDSPLAGETFVIRGSKIVVQTFVAVGRG